MNIYLKQDISDIVDIVRARARFQKVAILYDDSVSNLQIRDIYDAIKEDCIFNSFDISTLNIDELYDGYRLLIFKCGVDNFLRLDLNFNEFINVFMPTDSAVLPYLGQGDNEDNYLLLNEGGVDENVLASVYFNRFHSYLERGETSTTGFEFNTLTLTRMLELLKQEDKHEYKDLAILKSCHIPYRLLPLVDYVLICAYAVLVHAVAMSRLSLVDIYKTTKNDYALIDRFYAMNQNAVIIKLIKLNTDRIEQLVARTKLEILENVKLECFTELDGVISKIKEYLKHDDGLMGYIYLYDIFGV